MQPGSAPSAPQCEDFFTERVFADPVKAHRWLRKPSRALNGAVPIELIETEEGARIVENEIGVIDHGMFA